MKMFSHVHSIMDFSSHRTVHVGIDKLLVQQALHLCDRIQLINSHGRQVSASERSEISLGAGLNDLRQDAKCELVGARKGRPHVDLWQLQEDRIARTTLEKSR